MSPPYRLSGKAGIHPCILRGFFAEYLAAFAAVHYSLGLTAFAAVYYSLRLTVFAAVHHRGQAADFDRAFSALSSTDCNPIQR